MAQTDTPTVAAPPSPVSRHNGTSLEDLDLSITPPLQPTAGSSSNDETDKHELERLRVVQNEPDELNIVGGDDLGLGEGPASLQVANGKPERLNPVGSDDSELDREEPPPLQVAGGEPEGLDPVDSDGLDSGSFDLVTPAEQRETIDGKYELERRSELLFSSRHLQAIFDDSAELHHFSKFLYQHRPESVPLLAYYLDALKALRAIDYSNAVLRKLGHLTNFDFTDDFHAQPTSNEALRAKANAAFDVLTREDLPMYITHVWIQTVTVSITHRIMGTLRHASEGLAEVFCLTDPSRHDNPIVFMTEEFNRTTQYGVDYVIGRNCRFLQGPHTNPFSVTRIREKLNAGLEHCETFLNYRRDGSPFMNLVMLAPLYDSRGVIRYFIGAQVDVSGLAKACHGLGALEGLVDEDARGDVDHSAEANDEFNDLAEILGPRELEAVRERGGNMHRPPLPTEAGLRHAENGTSTKPSTDKNRDGVQHATNGTKHRVVLRESEPRDIPQALKEESLPSGPSTTAASLAAKHNGRLTGVYKNYLLVRPYPSLRILFTSPSLRVPGILQSPLLDRIGGSTRMRDQLVQALAKGQGVTAKVRWLNIHHRGATLDKPPRQKTQQDQALEGDTDADNNFDKVAEPEPVGRPRWLHCTPLVGSNGKVGVWMVVIVDDESEPSSFPRRHGHVAISQQQRPETGVSAKSTTDEVARGPQTNGHSPEARPRVRPRRSSDTLGSLPSNKPSRDDASATKMIHHNHSFSAQRAPKPPLASSSVPARFFNIAALSRASLVNGSHHDTTSSALEVRKQQRGSSKSSMLSRAETRAETPLWPFTYNNPFQSRRKREHETNGAPVVQNPLLERDNRGQDEDGETASIWSRGSAFTVRIDE